MAHRRGALNRDRTRSLAGAGLVWASLCAASCATGHSLPATLGDRTWRDLIETISEPSRPFDLSENLVSNEPGFVDRVRWLRPSGGAYIGVGPEQNFSYIAAMQPEIAFIVDIRRENLLLHLMYKALFEAANDRVEFVSRLFSRPRPEGIGSSDSVDDLFLGFERVGVSDATFEATLLLVRERLQQFLGAPVTDADGAWLRRTLDAFRSAGPDIRFWGSKQVDAVQPSYRALMTARDTTGVHRSFLATEASFRTVRNLHLKNLIVPVVGDFGGSGAIRRIGVYLREHGAVLDAFYASNVRAYLTNQQALEFCRSLAALPAAPRAVFLESNRMRSFKTRLKACADQDEAGELSK